MTTTTLLALILILAAAGWILGRRRALAMVEGDQRQLHSLPNYYGWQVAIFVMVPAFALLALWLAIQPFAVNMGISDMIPEERVAQAGSRALVMADVRRLAGGLDTAQAAGVLTAEEARGLSVEANDIRDRLAQAGVALGSAVDAVTLRAAQRYRQLAGWGDLARNIAVIVVAVAGFALAFRAIAPAFRARNTVERAVRYLLIFAAFIAVLTTVGIFLSLIFNTVKFLGLYPAEDFFLGLNWNPSFSGRGGGSELGILPLLWGTLYISFVALVVAVPIGLMAAIYLAEYASKKVRTYAKPALEILAGIPTIVYGLFALVTVGPLLVDVFGRGGLLGVNWMQGGTAVMTAGLVMGIMLIPFVSSLSDDIINSVPQSMRDGSLGIGATHSETVRQVVMPAALPGIVGAVLLAASRAIGETMIVVLGAGAAARLSLNPFDAMTTVTAKIVSQLTGDSDFSSPEALVAFALGITLFVITLGLNVFALYIVRRYREQYE
ncbi:phosphate ABC transporter permease subunit PstC [Salipiger sp. IMCC34102]|uniref:phosphate ABC transporter permease subunit PstC n=1 Tax=Salipiger sp. IMCC34102 TaxID=2510647 RepID=UPI00101E1375|nr:phosphate ABC transporter permease subunit PstC [Salipiger sp. IMCC34102]RYH03148.1 phosphate ABC transporter permease subunit PstC [Salipiger sp. IMCC34102]